MGACVRGRRFHPISLRAESACHFISPAPALARVHECAPLTHCMQMEMHSAAHSRPTHRGRGAVGGVQPGGAQRFVGHVIDGQGGAHLEWTECTCACFISAGPRGARASGAPAAARIYLQAAPQQRPAPPAPCQPSHLHERGAQAAVQPARALLGYRGAQRVRDAQVVPLRGLRRQPRAHQIQRVCLQGAGRRAGGRAGEGGWVVMPQAVEQQALAHGAHTATPQSRRPRAAASQAGLQASRRSPGCRRTCRPRHPPQSGARRRPARRAPGPACTASTARWPAHTPRSWLRSRAGGG